MTPMLVLQFSEGSQNAPKVQFCFSDGLEALWNIIKIGAEAKQSSPRQIRSDIVDDYAADGAAG